MITKTKVAVVFGGRSVEHEVSVITAHQIIEAADKEKYEVFPIYISKSGRWLTGKALLNLENFKNLAGLEQKLEEGFIFKQKKGIYWTSLSPFFPRRQRLDVFFPAIHGTFGEDGTLQGLLEMVDAPYVGCGVSASAVGMDKILQKDIFRQNGLSTVPYLWFLREEWEKDKNPFIEAIEKTLSYPVFVKPANLGSSVAISKCLNRDDLIGAMDLAFLFDRRVIVEMGLEDIIEINCSVLGYQNLEVSVCEQPLASGELLSYEDKYLTGGKTKGMASLSRLIPAPISKNLTGKIQEAAKKVFRITDSAGIARVDFMVESKTEKFYVCEINTLPGSLAFYLWEKSGPPAGEAGLPFPKLIDKLIDLAYDRFNDREKNSFSFSSNLLENFSGASKLQK